MHPVCDRNLENYKESAWSSMSELEQQLKQLEMNVAQQFGEVDDDDDDDERQCDDNDATAPADPDSYKEEEEDYVLDDSLYCIACKKAFKSDRALVFHWFATHTVIATENYNPASRRNLHGRFYT